MKSTIATLEKAVADQAVRISMLTHAVSAIAPKPEPKGSGPVRIWHRTKREIGKRVFPTTAAARGYIVKHLAEYGGEKTFAIVYESNIDRLKASWARYDQQQVPAQPGEF